MPSRHYNQRIMKLTELLEKDKEKLLTEISAAGTAEKAVPVLEKEVDKLLLTHNEQAGSDAERDEAAHMLQAVRLSLPLIDSNGYTKVWERGQGKDEGESKFSLTSILLLIGGLLLLGFGLFPLIMMGVQQVDSKSMTDFISRCVAILLGVTFLYISGSMYGKPKGKAKKEYQVEIKVDADRVYRNFRTVILSVDQSLEEVRLGAIQAKREQAGNIDGRPATTPELELFSDLLAASYSGDPEYALEKIDAIKYYLHKQQIEIVDYSEDTKQYFDLMPGTKTGTIRPAMVANGLVLKKGLASRG